jgi:alkylated DNA repair dioxygenase AlkB
VEHVLRSNRDAQADLNKIVPQEIEPEWAKAVHDLELEAATLMAMQEPGPEAEINLQDYGAKRRVRMKSGKVSWLDGQQSADRQKPGPKPQLGIALSARLRKVKQRCKARGVPFVLAEHIKPKELIHDHGTRGGADGH